MTRIRKRDWRFLLLVLAHAVCIFGFLHAGLRSESPGNGRWRAIDSEALQEKIRSGDLVKHEADWYRVVNE